MKLNRRNAGFTLIELMVVVIIIAALAGMVLPRFLPATNAAKRNIARADIASITTALKLYQLYNNGRYPTTEEGLDVLLKPSPSREWKDTFLEKKPIDPWNRKYEYRCPGSHYPTGFDLWSLGPDEKDPGDDITNWEENK